MQKRFFSGPTLEQAILDAARHHDLDPDLIRYVDRSKSSGRLRGGRRSVIEVDPDAPTAAPGGNGSGERTPSPATGAAAPEIPAPGDSTPDDVAPEAVTPEVAVPEVAATEVARQAEWAAKPVDAPAPAKRSHPAATATVGSGSASAVDAAEAAELALEALLRLGGLEVDWEIVEEDEGVSVDLSGPDSEEITAEEGEVLRALEHLLPRVLRGWHGKGVPVRVDCDGFADSRESELRELAAEVAEEVVESGEEETLDPMTPAERRIIHLALADHPSVTTESRGRGYRKRVTVFPRR